MLPPNCCCCNALAFLYDTTGSMSNGGFLNNLKSLALDTVDEFKQRICHWGVMDYKDKGDGSPYNSVGLNWIPPLFFGDFFDVPADLDTTPLEQAIDNYTVLGGGDTPEEQLRALEVAAINWIDWGGDGVTKILIWAGDASAHLNSEDAFYPLVSTTESRLIEAEIKLIAISNVSEGQGIDTPAEGLQGVASRLVAATGGRMFFNFNAGNIQDVIDAIDDLLGA